MTFIIPLPTPRIVCTECLQRTEVVVVYDGRDYYRVILQVACKCGRFLGMLDRQLVQTKHPLPIERQRMDPMTPDEAGKWGQEMREHAQQRMLDAEKLITAATWAREGKAT